MLVILSRLAADGVAVSTEAQLQVGRTAIFAGLKHGQETAIFLRGIAVHRLEDIDRVLELFSSCAKLRDQDGKLVAAAG